MRTQRAFDALPENLLETSAAHSLQKQLDELNKYRNMLRDTAALANIRDALKAVKNAGGIGALQKAAKEAQRARNMIGHGLSNNQMERPGSRPAYSLDEEDDDV